MEISLKLEQYLQKIVRKEPINFSVFLGVLPKRWFSIWREIFEASKINNAEYVVEVISESLFDRLVAEVELPNCRVGSALKGNSHASPTSASHAIVKFAASGALFPDVVVCGQGFWSSNYHGALSDELVVIENEEAFSRRDEFLSCFPDSEFLLTRDCFFGSGMQMASKKYTEFLSQYKRVLLFVDYDLGGLKMFAAMQSLCGGKVEFVLPSNVESIYEKFKLKPKSSIEWKKALDHANKQGLTELVKAFISTECFLEQETFLVPQESNENDG